MPRSLRAWRAKSSPNRHDCIAIAATPLSAAPAQHHGSFHCHRKTAMSRNAVTWFEIPAADLDRAQRFYESVLATSLKREQMGDEQLAVFPYEQPGAGGCLQRSATPVVPSRDGTRVYLDASPSLDAALARVERAGGRVATPKVALPPGMGYFAHIEDSEGNVVGLRALA
jgi:uncharacterized protein